MAGAAGVVEGVPSAQLLKTAEVVQQAAQPREVAVLVAQVLVACDGVARVRNAQGVRHLECDAGIARVVGRDVAVERLEGARAIDVQDDHLLKTGCACRPHQTNTRLTRTI